MPAGSTYTPIATTTLGSAAVSVTFSSVPSTYTDLVLVLNGTTPSSIGIGLRFNSDSGTNYSNTFVAGDGSAAFSGRASNFTMGRFGNINTSNTTAIAQIQNYSNTTTFKTTLGRAATPADFVVAYVNLWRNTAAINNIVVITDNSSTQFQTGTTFTLYGIASA
jgi:hypothetical protein